MRGGLVGSILAVCAAAIALSGMRRRRLRLAPAEPRRAGRAVLVAAALDPGLFAVSASLWPTPAGWACRVPTVYGGAPSAQFLSTLRFSIHAARRMPAAAARSAAWVARQQLDLSAANDADIASKIVSEPAAPAIVRILRAGPYRRARTRLSAAA